MPQATPTRQPVSVRAAERVRAPAEVLGDEAVGGKRLLGAAALALSWANIAENPSPERHARETRS